MAATVTEREAGTTVRTTTYGYDVEDRTTLETLYDNAASAYVKIIRYAYEDATGRQVATWTASNLATATDLNAARTSATTLSEYGYDRLGRLESTTLARMNGASASQATTSTYDPVGNLDTVTSPNGVIEDYDYDALNRLDVLLARKADGKGIFSQDYTLQNDGQRDLVIEKRYNDATGAPPATTKVDWTYAG